jgi:large subunit ribosomal protein L1
LAIANCQLPIAAIGTEREGLQELRQAPIGNRQLEIAMNSPVCTSEKRMKQHGKKYRAALEKIEPGRKYNLESAIAKVKEISFAKFDETVELTVWLGVDPRKADQLVRGTIVLPHGLGKSKTVLVIAQGDKLREAEEAGADIVGGEDIVNRIKGGWTDFDAVIATPDMMRLVGQLGKVLGPRGLMPNPKTGTVTPDVTTAVKETKAGKVEYRVDKTGVIHVGVGKVSFDADKLRDNAKALLDAVVKAKPATAKGKYVKKVNLASTMSPGVLMDEALYAK